MAHATVKTRAFLIDGTAFCYRAFYAIRGLSTSDGRPTNAVYGFVMMLEALREKHHPEYVAVAFDVGKPTFRHQKFEDYKGQRKPMPEPLIGQLPLIKRLLAAYRIPMFEQEGFEAEDVLATIAKRVASDSVDVLLVTGDKDALQLVDTHVKVFNPHSTKGEMLWDAASVRARYGVGPEHVVDLMALIGDPTDNIPGVPGLGPTTAANLLQQFGSLQNLYDHLDEVESPSRRKALESYRDQVELSQDLARINSDVPLEVTIEQLSVQEPDGRALRSLFRELEFKRLLRTIEAGIPTPPLQGVRAHRVTSPQELGRLLSRLHSVSETALGCWPALTQGETDSTRRAGEAIVAVSMSADEAWVVWVDKTLLDSAQGQQFTAWLADPQATKVCHDAKAAMGLLRGLGIGLSGVGGDTMVAAYLLNPARSAPTLSDLSDEYLNGPIRQSPQIASPLELTSQTMLEWFAHATCTVRRLHEQFLPTLRSQHLETLYAQLELPLLAVLAEMEATGVAIDVPYLKALRATMEAKLTQLIEELYRLAGCTFNLNSPKQLAQVLFERLHLPVVKRTKTGPSTDSSVLQQLASRHPFPAALIEYRELSKLVSTYVDALPQLVDARTGRIHTSFNQTATATGRLSTSEPNLQNIPVKTELGRQIRKAFVPGEAGWLLVAADYSQIELRILAHLSGDEQLIEAFRQERDIHRYTASLIYGVAEGDVTAEMRSAMKAVNFGILYGMSAHGLSKELGVSHEEAAACITAYFERYPSVRRFLDAQIAQAKRDGYVQTLLGRRRAIPELSSPDPLVRQFGERVAVNAPIQGSAADLIKQAMIRVAVALRERQMASRMILQVHDELLFECPPHEQERLATVVRDIMEHALELAVPLRVVVKSGFNWLEIREEVARAS